MRKVDKFLSTCSGSRASERLQRADLLEAVVGINEAIQRLTTLNEGVVNLPSSLDEDRPTILKRQSNEQTNPNGHSRPFQDDFAPPNTLNWTIRYI